MRRSPLARKPRRYAATPNWTGGKRYDSGLEAGHANRLALLERAGAIRALVQKRRHTFYIAPGLAYCDCGAGKPPGVEDPGGERVRAVYPDYEYEEKTPEGDWVQVTADAKGWLDPTGGQFLAYKLFKAIHGRAILLLTKRDL